MKMRADRLLRYAGCITMAVCVMMFTGCGGTQNKDIVVTQEPDRYSTSVENVRVENVRVENVGQEDTGNDSAVADSTAVENITCFGPYGSISIRLPEGWKYELRGVDDDKKFMADYGIQIYPEGVKKGYVEIGYFSSWGVCGTGLEEERVTVAGDEAFVGYYDGSKIWDFVTYGGDNEGVVALTNKADGWWDDYSEQVMTILDSLHFDSGETSESIGVCNEASVLEDIALSVSAKDIWPQKARLVFKQYDDSIKGELSFGEQYKIEKKIEKQKGSGWKEADIVAEGDYGFKDVANLIKKNGSVEHEYDWSWLYGSLKPGEYRISIEVMASNETGEYEKYPVCVYFAIR